MTVPQLTSKDNPLLKTIRLVSSGARRAPRQLVAAEGIRLGKWSALALPSKPWSFRRLRFYSQRKSLFDRWIAKGSRSSSEANPFSIHIDGETPQGAIALVNVPETTLESVPQAHNALMLFACGIQDPGNLGTLIRTAAAADASLVATTKGTVSVHSPKVIRSSAGSVFRLPLVERVEASNFRHYCEQLSIRIYRTDAREGVVYRGRSGFAVRSPRNEEAVFRGVVFRLSAIRIPLAHGVESLNGGGRSRTSLRSAQAAPQQLRKEIRHL
jgi:TrmH family RNA methyltransferase